jgi:hypothetical protein
METETNRKSVYQVEEIPGAKLATVDAGKGRKFLIASGNGSYPKTVIFSWAKSVGCWVEVAVRDGVMDPELAVMGYLLSDRTPPTPIERLERQIEIGRAEFHRVLNQKMRLHASRQPSKPAR